jgi:hypothetical protein
MQLKLDALNARKRRGSAVLTEVLPQKAKKPNINAAGKMSRSSSPAAEKSPVKQLISPLKGMSPLDFQITPIKTSLHPSPVKKAMTPISKFTVSPAKTNTPGFKVTKNYSEVENLDDTLPAVSQDESKGSVEKGRHQDEINEGNDIDDSDSDDESSSSSSSSSGDFSSASSDEAEVAKLMTTIDQLKACTKVSEQSRLQCLQEKKELEKRVLALEQEKKELQEKVDDSSQLTRKLTQLGENFTKMEEENRHLNSILQSIKRFLSTGCYFPPLPCFFFNL